MPFSNDGDKYWWSSWLMGQNDGHVETIVGCGSVFGIVISMVPA